MLHLLLLLLTFLRCEGIAWAAPCSETSQNGSQQSTTSSHAPRQTALPPLANTTEKVALTWWTEYNSGYLAIEDISWDKYTTVNYAFATVSDPTGTLGIADTEKLKSFVKTAHAHSVKALLTVGGWAGSTYFSYLVGSDANRTDFTDQLVALAANYSLDGFDFDWEYPVDGKGQSQECLVTSANDTSNFLLFLADLRRASPNLTLSAAAPTTPWPGPSDLPYPNLSQFATVLDYITIMAYDLWSVKPTVVGPNAPLDDACAPAGERYGSVTSALQAWTNAMFPANQIVLGVPAYGHSYYVADTDAFNGTTLAQYPHISNATRPRGDARDGYTNKATCGSNVGFSGVFTFTGMVDLLLLDDQGNPTNASNHRYDNCSQTPYLYIPENSTMVSYDDPTSFAAKGNFIASQGLRGFGMWEAANDRNDVLLDEIRSAAGF